MKKAFILSISALLLLISFVYYSQTHFSTWGFNLSKYDLKNVIVYSDKHTYLITDKEMVFKIAKDVSGWKKYSNIESFPPSATHKKYEKLLLHMKDNITYGGSMWDTGHNVLIDSNGSFWALDYHTFNKTLNAAIKNATILN